MFLYSSFAFPLKFLSLPFPSILFFSNMLLNTPVATLWNAAISGQEVGRCLLAPFTGFALPTWGGGMRKTFKGGVWVWGRLRSAQSWVGANLFPWAALNQTQVVKSIPKMCHGLLRCLGFKTKKRLECEVLVRSQLWDELRAHVLTWDSKVCLPALLGLLVTTFLPMQYPWLWSDATAAGALEVLKVKSLVQRKMLS